MNLKKWWIKNEKKWEKKRKNYYVLGKQACNNPKTCGTMVTGCGVPLGQEFGTCTCTCVIHDHNTVELPIPVLHPSRHAMGSCAQAAPKDWLNPWPLSVFGLAVETSGLSSFSGTLTEDILLSICWTVIFIMCGKHMILWSLASKENISHSSNNFSKCLSILLLVVRLSRVQWPDCMSSALKSSLVWFFTLLGWKLGLNWSCFIQNYTELQTGPLRTGSEWSGPGSWTGPDWFYIHKLHTNYFVNKIKCKTQGDMFWQITHHHDAKR